MLPGLASHIVNILAEQPASNSTTLSITHSLQLVYSSIVVTLINKKSSSHNKKTIQIHNIEIKMNQTHVKCKKICIIFVCTIFQFEFFLRMRISRRTHVNYNVFCYNIQLTRKREKILCYRF